MQGKGITPDINIEQGEFESYDFKVFEADLKDSLDKDEEVISDNKETDKELSNLRKD